MKFDSILRETGEFGRYQLFLFALFCCPVCAFISYVIFGQLWMTIPPPHFCRVSELDASNLSSYQKKALSIPLVDSDGQLDFDQCRMFDRNYSTLLVLLTNGQLDRDDRANLSVVPCNDGWTYNFTEQYPTAVSEWDWVCDDSWKPYLAQSVFFVGCAIGCFFLGLVADMFGRVPALFLANGIACAAGIATAFSQGFVSFIIFRFLAGMSFNTCFLAYYIIVLEYTGPSKRTLISNISFGVFHCFSACMIPWVAYAIWDWRMFAIVTAAPIGIVLPLCFVIPESASWLLTRGKVDKAIKIIEEVARFNRKHLSPAVMDDLKRKLKETEPLEQKKYTLLDVMRKKTLRKRALVMFLVWFLISLCADGHARNTHNLGYSVFFTFSASSATQLPAAIIVLLTLDRIGRRWSAFLSLIIGGVVCLFIAAVPYDMKWFGASMALVGRLMINVSFNIGLQYAPELLPTVVRGQAVSATHLIGFVANILSPFVVYLAKYYVHLPLLTFGLLSVIGAFFCLLLPETLHENLPHSLEDGDNFGRDQKFLHFPCFRKNRDLKSGKMATSGD